MTFEISRGKTVFLIWKFQALYANIDFVPFLIEKKIAYVKK